MGRRLIGWVPPCLAFIASRTCAWASKTEIGALRLQARQSHVLLIRTQKLALRPMTVAQVPPLGQGHVQQRAAVQSGRGNSSSTR